MLTDAFMPFVLSGGITLDPVTAGGVVAGLILTLLGIRYYLSNIWRQEAEGYQQALQRQKDEHDDQVRDLQAQVTVLAQRIRAQDDEIVRLQQETNVVPLFEMSKEIKQIAEDARNLLNGRTEIIQRMDAAIMRSTDPEYQQPALDAIAQIRHLVEESDAREHENAELFAKLYKEIFPMIVGIYASVVEGGGSS